jgi:AcrR family transcriptional regulator
MLVPGMPGLAPARGASIRHWTPRSCRRYSQAEHGYDRLSMDDIAARAHVGKAAIYRRWPSKGAVVVGAILWWREQVAAIAAPDTGSLRGDAEAMITAVPDFDDADRGIISVILGVATAAAHDPLLAAALEEHALARPREALAATSRLPRAPAGPAGTAPPRQRQ